MTLSNEQKEQILLLFEEGVTNLNDLTHAIFGNEEIDGRSREGRSIRTFLIREGKEYGTTQSTAAVDAELTEEQERFLLESDRIDGMSALEIAQTVFENNSIISLSSHHRLVLEYLRTHRPELLDRTDNPAEEDWVNPKSMRSALRLVNKWAYAELGDKPEELSSRNRKYIEVLLKYMRSYKLKETMNSFMEQSDRDLFESEFVRAVWDKPDLTNDELNLYMTVCSNYIRVKHIQIRITSLNKLLLDQQNDSEAGGRDITISLTERLKSTSDELNQTEKRNEALITKLNGDRSKRLNSQMANNGSFLILVEEFQQKESRDRYLELAKRQNKAVKEEADRLESVADIKARVFGISKEELL